MSSADEAAFDDRRCRYRGCATDLGVECQIVDMPVDIFARKRDSYHKDDPLRFLFPNMLGVAEMLHVL